MLKVTSFLFVCFLSSTSAWADASHAEANGPKQPHPDFKNETHKKWISLKEAVGDQILQRCNGTFNPAQNSSLKSSEPSSQTLIDLRLDSLAADNDIIDLVVQKMDQRNVTETELKIFQEATNRNNTRCYWLPYFSSSVSLYEQASGKTCDSKYGFSSTMLEQAESQCARAKQLAIEFEYEATQWSKESEQKFITPKQEL